MKNKNMHDYDVSYVIMKDVCLAVAYFYHSGLSKSSMWGSFDEVFTLACRFVAMNPPSKNWEDSPLSFEEAVELFYLSNMKESKL